MYNNLSESTDAIVPNEIIEKPPIQNNNDTSQINKYTEYFKKTVRRLGFTTIALSVVLFFMSIAEKAIAACKEEHRYWYDYDYGNLTTVCYPHLSWGVGIWCSILPFIAGICGVLAGSKSSSQKKNGLLIGFSTAGAVMSFVLIVIQSFLTHEYQYYRFEVPAKYELQIVILCTTGVNFVLLIISSAYSCCLCKCCCRQLRSSVEHRVVYTYVTHDAKQPLPKPGTVHNPQEMKTFN